MADWGSVPGWVEAIGTAGSLLIIGTGLLREIRLRRIDDARTAAERRDAEADQARLVTASFQFTATDRGTFNIRNDSLMPIRQIGYTLRGDGGPEATGRLDDYIAPQEVVQAGCPLPPDLVGDHIGQGVAAGIEFTDAAGRRWKVLEAAGFIFRRVGDGWTRLP